MAGSTAEANLRAIARNAETFPRKFVKSAVAELRKATTKTLKADTGGDAILSRAAQGAKGHRATKLKIKTSVKGSSAIVTGTVEAASPRAQWFWLEEGTAPHQIGSRRLATGPQHPGTKPGKKTWSRAVTPELKRLQREAQRSLTAIMHGR